MGKRLSKALAAAGIASRRACEKIIASGRVCVNGDVVLLPQTLVNFETDKISLDGKKIQGEEEKVYFLLNKPVGYLCTHTQKKGGAKRVFDLFSHLPHRLFTAGRLDFETSGLIIVTNDGEFANRVIHPRFNISKEYLVKTDQEITVEHLQTLSNGCQIERSFIKPLAVKKVRKGTLKIVVGEGKKHEVRIMLANAKLNVRELTRIRIGPLNLGTLLPGEYRELTVQEMKSFFLNDL